MASTPSDSLIDSGYGTRGVESRCRHLDGDIDIENIPTQLIHFVKVATRLLLGRDGVNADPTFLGLKLLFQASMDRNEAALRLLLSRGDLNPDSKSPAGVTPLMTAVVNGHEPVVRLLLGRDDVNPDSKNNTGHTPLWWAVRKDTIV
jgi:ankyrin repeat protein